MNLCQDYLCLFSQKGPHVHHYAYPALPVHKQTCKRELQCKVDSDILEESGASERTSPCFFVTKKDAQVQQISDPYSLNKSIKSMISLNVFWDTNVSLNLIFPCNIIHLNLMNSPRCCVSSLLHLAKKLQYTQTHPWNYDNCVEYVTSLLTTSNTA